ncbi:MAG: sporulation protein YabP [Bacillota bacterium]
MSANKNLEKKHHLSLKNRKKLEIDGVKEVISYNESEINLQTNRGILDIKGNNLNIQKLNLEDSSIIVEGNINLLEYDDKNENKSKSIFKRLFK